MPTAKAKIKVKIRQNIIFGSPPIILNIFPFFLNTAFKVKNKNSNASRAERAKITLQASHMVIFKVQNPTNAFINIAVGKVKATNYKNLYLKVFEYKGDLNLSKSKLAYLNN